MKRVITFLFILLLFISCNSTEPETNESVNLTAVDIGCTEVWINAELSNLSLPIRLQIKDNDSTYFSTTLETTDTTILVKNLSPDQTYKLRAEIAGQEIKSHGTSFTTLDTTSHEFAWETFTFGTQQISIFRDVAIIDENNIWAIGEITTDETNTYDSNGVRIQPYNAAHWDGTSWELKRIMFLRNYDNPNPSKFPYPAKSIFVTNDNEVMISGNAQIVILKNNEQVDYITMKDIEWEERFGIKGIWGKSIDDFYVIGDYGKILHYYGGSWKKIDSGTDINLRKICGTKNGEKIFVTGYTNNTSLRTIILEIEGDNCSTFFYSEGYSSYCPISGLDIKDDLILFSTTQGYLWRYFPQLNTSDYLTPEECKFFNYAICDIKINNKNDVIFGGAGFAINHFNGASFDLNLEIRASFSVRGMYGCDYNGNIAVLAGSAYGANSALLAVGKR